MSISYAKKCKGTIVDRKQLGGNTRSTAPAIVLTHGAHIEFLAEINLMIHVFLF